MIRLIYSGLERCDFVYYLAQLVASTSAQVIVNDTSITGDLFRIFPTEEQYYEYKNIIFARNLDEYGSFEALDGIDYYIEYRGMVNHSLGNTPNTFHFIMPSYTRDGVELVSTMRPEGEVTYILRDYCNWKVTDKSFALVCGLEPSAISGHIPLSVDDIGNYNALSINGHQRFVGLSEEMNQALIYAFATVTMLPEKEAEKIFKKIRKVRK